MNNNTTIKNISQIDKIIKTLYELEIIDDKLFKKYKRNEKELAFYNDILEESNNNFYITIKNFEKNIN